MAYFVWIKNQQPWCALMFMPQVIHDEKAFEYKELQKSMIVVGQKHPLTDEEVRLSINDLAKRFPPPEVHDGDY